MSGAVDLESRRLCERDCVCCDVAPWVRMGCPGTKLVASACSSPSEVSWPPKALPFTVLFSRTLPPLAPPLPPLAPPLPRRESWLRALLASVPETSALEGSIDEGWVEGATEAGLRARRGSRAPRPLPPPPPPLRLRLGLDASD
jgi:hypothetical protein